jgi:hypothetical protein
VILRTPKRPGQGWEWGAQERLKPKIKMSRELSFTDHKTRPWSRGWESRHLVSNLRLWLAVGGWKKIFSPPKRSVSLAENYRPFDVTLSS